MTVRSAAFAFGGLVSGMALIMLALYFWPFAFEDRTRNAVEALAKADGVAESFFLNITGDSILATHGGNFPLKAFPATMPLLGNGQIPNTFVLLTKFRDAPDGNVIAFGTELEIAHEDSRLIGGRLMTHTLWSIVVPGRGVLHLYQTENNWRLFKRVMLPMLLTGKAFDGEFKGVNTLGPAEDFRGMIVGGTGAYAGLAGHFIELGTLRGATPDGGLTGQMELRVKYSNRP